MNDNQRKLREEAIAKLTIKFDDEIPEAVVSWDGTPIVAIRSESFGGDWEDNASPGYFGEPGRFKIYSWDNDDQDGEWTGNLHDGRPLWESSLTWPPKPNEPKEDNA